mmetsp:Transcript_3055/g.5158  ORF Transcript_3055/g.5158 Transcript_3055/m.5158 type:complete len:145 (-) Transcript_3055:646-1080(-)
MSNTSDKQSIKHTQNLDVHQSQPKPTHTVKRPQPMPNNDQPSMAQPSQPGPKVGPKRPALPQKPAMNVVNHPSQFGAPPSMASTPFNPAQVAQPPPNQMSHQSRPTPNPVAPPRGPPARAPPMNKSGPLNAPPLPNPVHGNSNM